MLSSIAEFNALKSILKASGISYTEPEALPTIERPTTTAADVAQAILNSKKANPYADPTVQTVIAEYSVSKAGEVFAAQSKLREQHVIEHARAQLPDFLEQAKAQFDHATQDLHDAHNTLGDVEHLHTIDLNNAPAHIADAALKATRAITTIEATIAAWKRVHQLHSRQTSKDSANAYMRGNPPFDMLLRYRKQQVDFTIWAQQIEGVEFALVSPNEAQKNYNRAQAEFDRDKRRVPNYLTGKHAN